MAQSNFGAGFLFGTTSGGTPRLFGALQDVSVDFSFDMKQLHGTYQYALEQARGKGKIEAKASIGRIDPLLFNDLFFGQTAATGEVLGSILESGTVPATPYQITVTNGATFANDLGVLNVATGLFLTKVASAPATGQYSVSAAGVYTFAAADTLMVVKICYTYGSTTTGKKVVATNQVMGSGPIFRVDLINTFRGKTFTLSLNAVQSSKLSIPFKLDDFTIPSIDLSAQDDGSGGVFTFSSTG